MAKKSNLINLILLCVFLPVFTVLSRFLFENRQYYIPAVVMVIVSMLPFFVSFERKKTSVREVAVLAALIAIAVASRTVFYAFPQIKPIAAIVIIAGAAFGYEVGFFVGSMSMLLSNIIFGQGMWTPFQMLAMGMIGLVCSLLFGIEKIGKNRIVSAVTGGIVTFFVYGLIVDMSSVFMIVSEFSLKSIAAVYFSGVAMNAVFAIVTAVCLFVFGKSFIQKLSRLKIKYGIFEKQK